MSNKTAATVAQFGLLHQEKGNSVFLDGHAEAVDRNRLTTKYIFGFYTIWQGFNFVNAYSVSAGTEVTIP
jgi:prepilin-type processing-associated H-X9-DG protein